MDFPLNLEEKEQINAIDQDALLLWNNSEKKVCVVLTNFRFIIFYDINKEDSQREMLRLTKAMGYLPCYENLLELNRTDIMEVLKEEKFDKYILKNSNYFYLSSKMIYNHFKK